MNKNKNIYIILFEISSFIIFSVIAYNIYFISNKIETNINNKDKMILLSDELRQSSDDLTHFARTYVITNNEKYKLQYYKVLDIRDGKIARPKRYETIYWDLKESIREKRHPADKKSSLNDRVNKLPFSQSEKDKLSLSHNNSNDLVNLEVQSFALMQSIQKNPLNQMLAIKLLHSKEYYQAKHKIMNPLDEFMIILHNRINENSENLHNEISKYILLLSLLSFIFILTNIVIYLYLTSKDKKMLNDSELTKNELQKTLSSFDKNIIYSKTDLTGNITQVSKAFCEISGYSSDELIGQHHNLIRHPDMDKEVFKDIWKTLKDGNSWYGEVKNRKKDGTYYWVSTSIELEYDNNAQHIGYNAIRHNITAQKEIENLKNKLENININLEKQVNERVNEIITLDKEIQDTQKEVIFTMGSIAESRSKETGNHVKRVAEYTKLLALYYGLAEDEAELLKQASPMHDIGKVAIPDAILNKPARFNEDEREIMNTHAQLGYDMLKHSDRPLLKMASIVAYEHHEKWNGTGYPNSLKGEDIHIYGRITAVADVFDALGSDRVYKKSWELDKILDLFKEERGKQFDPQLIDIFFENLDEFLKIRDQFKD